MDTRGAYNRECDSVRVVCISCQWHRRSRRQWEEIGASAESCGARTLQQIIQAPPSVCAPVLSSFMEQTQEQLVLLATHPVGSRAVIEAILTGPNDFNRAKQGIVDGLGGRLVDVASDRFGTYVVQKCYAIARLQRKEAMAQELSKKRECFLEMHMAGMFCALAGQSFTSRALNSGGKYKECGP